MQTDVLTPQRIFIHPQQLLIPPFQRPYVWEKEEQWAPLWHDIRRLTELLIADPNSHASHFLGAIVLQAQEHGHGNVQLNNIIDGQQRLTTLQLLMDATAAVLEESGMDDLTGQLDMLTHNQAMYVGRGESRLKVRHANRDREAFDEVMDADPPVAYERLKHSGSRLVKAHQYFIEVVAEWLGDASALGYALRASTLVRAMTGGVQIVSINLAPLENSQEIFETLNARGTPLTAADLIKNFVFQRLHAEGTDTKTAYAEHWPFESRFWEETVSVGRYPISRSSLFFNQWLTAHTGEEVSPKSTFTRFKHFIELESKKDLSDLLPHITQQAAHYETWTLAARDADRQLDRVELAMYRMQASELELLKPLLLWLHDPEQKVPKPVIDAVIDVTESWVIRRQMLRLASGDLGRIVAELIRVYSSAEPDDLAERISSHLSRLNVASSYWPGDDEIRLALVTEPAYRRFRRGRLRMLLEAIEDRQRLMTNQPQVSRRGYPIEHVLPQHWEKHWAVDSPEDVENRAAHVHRLGNLTLLTQTLNSKVSNGPWNAKRSALVDHDTLLLNSRLLSATADREWTEDEIDARTNTLIDDLLAIWPVPDGHVGEIVDRAATLATWVEVKHLLTAGLIAPGTKLRPRFGDDYQAVIRPDGWIQVGDQSFGSPSGAGQFVRGRSTNGWTFWRLDDGRTLSDVRAQLSGTQKPSPTSRHDWSTLHAILEGLPAGRWTSYGNLADVLGTSAQAVGNHIAACRQCANAHRVRLKDGTVADGFAWDSAADERDPTQMLAEEGVPIFGGKADGSLEFVVEDLSRLIDSP